MHVGYSPHVTARILPFILRAYQRAQPKVRITLHDRSNQKSIAGLRDGPLHLAFLPRLPKASELRDIRLEELTRERVCLVVAPSSSVCASPQRSTYRRGV
jgi:DNA-binding transcriptional LysR family regulator